MLSQPVWWPVVVTVAFLAVLVLVIVFTLALEESIFSSSDGEGGEATSQSNIEESSSKRKPLQNTSLTHVSDPPQVSSPTQYKEQTVVQMDTDDADKQQELGASSGPSEDSRRGENARSENPDLQTQESVKSRGSRRRSVQ